MGPITHNNRTIITVIKVMWMLCLSQNILLYCAHASCAVRADTMSTWLEEVAWMT